MDSGVRVPNTTVDPAPAGLPVRMDTVVVFGDSLSDIGKKFAMMGGKAARAGKFIYMSPTGRFSDCRNWTDFMFEAATKQTMIVGTAKDTIALSRRHRSFSQDSIIQYDYWAASYKYEYYPYGHFQNSSFAYANYAEGGACGDTPAGKWSSILGTFSQQVDAFEADCRASSIPLGNTLFIIWLGGNDLYSAGRRSIEMPQVAEQIAQTQRRRLAAFVSARNTHMRVAATTCKFIFVDLCRPLTTVRYTQRLLKAEARVTKLLGANYQIPTRRLGGMSQAVDLFNQGITNGYRPGLTRYQTENEMNKLRAKIAEIKNFENGVLLFNATLKKIAHANGDRVAEVSWCVSEDTILNLVNSNYRLLAGAMGQRVKSHIPANDYLRKTEAQHITTVDEVHPTDQMYRLLWLEIYEQIRRSGCTFGLLGPAVADPGLAGLAGAAQPSPETVQAYGAVMNELRTKRHPIE